MPAYNFKARFADKVRSGVKRTTLRRPRLYGNAIPGEPVQLYTGMRSPSCAKLITPDPIVRNVKRVTVDPLMRTVFGHNGNQYSADELLALAAGDGFTNLIDFFMFFGDEYGKDPIDMLLIEW